MRLPVRGGAAAVALAAAAVAVGGCADEETTSAPSKVAKPAKQAASTIDRLERALRARDYGTVCDELLTPPARVRAGGDRCAATMAEAAGTLTRPRIRPLSIRIVGRRAEIRVRSRAAGQRAIEDTIQLERRDGGYRISALAR